MSKPSLFPEALEFAMDMTTYLHLQRRVTSSQAHRDLGLIDQPMGNTQEPDLYYAASSPEMMLVELVTKTPANR